MLDFVVLSSLVVWLASGLTVDAPASLRAHILSPIGSQFMGIQDPTFNVTALAAHLDVRTCGTAGFDPSAVVGRVVFTSNSGSSLTLIHEQDLALCLEHAGAVAVVRRLTSINTPGPAFTWSEDGLYNQMSIPFVTVLAAPSNALVLAVQSGTNVTVTVTPDPNPWMVELYTTAAFLIVMRIGLCLLNAFASLIALEALLYHLHRLYFSAVKFTSPRAKTTVQIMAFGSLLELGAALIRCVWCGIGPVLSTPRITYANHMYCLYIQILLDTITTLISVDLFYRWGAFGSTRFLTRHFESVLIVAALLNIGLNVSIAILQARSDYDSTFLILLTAFVTFASLVISGVAFGVFGMKLVNQLQANAAAFKDDGGARKRGIKKAVRWIMLSAIFILVQIAGTVGAIRQEWIYNPQGNFVIFALLLYGTSLAGLSQAFAFRPISESHVGIAQRVAAHVLLAWHIRPESSNKWAPKQNTEYCT